MSNLQYDGSSIDTFLRRPEIVDLLLIFLVRYKMTHTLEAFQREWYVLQQRRESPDCFVQNKELQKVPQIEKETMRGEAEVVDELVEVVVAPAEVFETVTVKQEEEELLPSNDPVIRVAIEPVKEVLESVTVQQEDDAAIQVTVEPVKEEHLIEAATVKQEKEEFQHSHDAVMPSESRVSAIQCISGVSAAARQQDGHHKPATTLHQPAWATVFDGGMSRHCPRKIAPGPHAELESALIIEAEAAHRRGHHESVLLLLRSQYFDSSHHEQLQHLWLAAVYSKESLLKQRKLNAVDRYRLRKRYPFPANIWEGEKTMYCLKKSVRDILNLFYEQNAYPTITEKRMLTHSCELSYVQICNWFKNKRMREKEALIIKSCPFLPKT